VTAPLSRSDIMPPCRCQLTLRNYSLSTPMSPAES
jgi:hypothetical protein